MCAHHVTCQSRSPRPKVRKCENRKKSERAFKEGESFFDPPGLHLAAPAVTPGRRLSPPACTWLALSPPGLHRAPPAEIAVAPGMHRAGTAVAPGLHLCRPAPGLHRVGAAVAGPGHGRCSCLLRLGRRCCCHRTTSCLGPGARRRCQSVCFSIDTHGCFGL